MTPKRNIHPLDGAAGTQSASARMGKALLPENPPSKLEIVLKCDLAGSVEAISLLISNMRDLAVPISIVHSGLGTVSKSDLLMALSAGRLVIGFNVGMQPKLEGWVKEHGVEVRLYNVIYYMAEDLKKIAESMISREPEEKILGRGEVIAKFKSSHGAVIAGCTVQEGRFAVGDSYRIISAMGPVYSGRILSLHIEERTVREAAKGQQAGIKIPDFPGIKLGDIVECYEFMPVARSTAWKPTGRVLHMEN